MLFLGPGQSRVFYGFVAVGDDPKTAVVALRGTATTTEWWDDLHWDLVPFTQVSRRRKGRPGLLADVGVGWSSETRRELERVEGPIETHDAADAIREVAAKYEPQVRALTGSLAPYDLSIETTTINAYWAFWTDGCGSSVRLRLNLREASFTEAHARQFALHEILGHGLQGASYAQRCANEPVPWVRLLSVHTPQQVMLEGLGQALPLFVAPDDKLCRPCRRLRSWRCVGGWRSWKPRTPGCAMRPWPAMSGQPCSWRHWRRPRSSSPRLRSAAGMRNRRWPGASARSTRPTASRYLAGGRACRAEPSDVLAPS
jgi:hypothetical protein